MRKLVTLMAGMLLLCHISFAQTIKGKIVDAQNKMELIGATVVIEGTSIGAAAGLDGSFTLNVPKGKKTLNVTFVGYIDQKIELDLAAGETKDLGEINLEPNAVGLQEIRVVSSFAQDRKTPVALSKIEPITIEEKLGTQEFPEILKSTPSVYATKNSGGYGDGRINLRGFESNNIGVLINGVPVNDMESGKVYWSNWSGLSEVTRNIQVQRGLGASKLAISSVGGTINILTNSTEAKKGGSVYYGIGNNGYKKIKFSASTGMLENGWAATIAGTKETGDGYIKATDFEAYSYFMNISKKVNEDHLISFVAFGAPQWHNQRYTMHEIDYFREHKDGRRLNSNYGIREGKIYNASYNRYHKPQISLNHYWNIDKETMLSTAVYATFSNGGGRRIEGSKDKWLEYPKDGNPEDSPLLLTYDGLLNWDAVLDSNANSVNGSQAIEAMAVNRHDWYGVLSTFSKTIDNIQIIAGFDGRYYKAYHYTEITDLLGGKFFLDNANYNRDPNTLLKQGDKMFYHNIGEVFWEGIFGQVEYTKDLFSAFASISFSNTSYRRIDYFSYFSDDLIEKIDNNQQLEAEYIDRLGEDEFETAMKGQKSDLLNFSAYSGKTGFNYNLNENFNIFLNGGYFTRAPYFRYAFRGHTNEINEGVEHEKVTSGEFGAGFRNSFIKANLAIYHTRWLDKALTVSVGNNETANILGLNAIHQGVELEAWVYPTKKIDIKLMGSLGDWVWQDDVQAEIYDNQQNFIDDYVLYAKDLHVGDAAQTTMAFGINYEFLPKFKLGLDFNHYSRLYSNFDVNNRINASESGKDAWRLPDYQLLDMNMSYRFKIGDYRASFFANVNNLLDTEYISDGKDGGDHDALTSLVYYGFGRTWSTGMKINF